MDKENENPIKLWVSLTAIVAALALAIYCIVLWNKVDAEREKLTDLCEASIASTCQRLESLAETGEDSDYISAVADFRAFQQSYSQTVEEPGDRYLTLNRVYAAMTFHPEDVKAHLTELTEALELLREDYSSQEGYVKLSELLVSIGE